MAKKIIYIGGIGHSGSTILSILLGNKDGVISLGEFGSFGEKNRICSCGRELKSCERWGKIYSNLNYSDKVKLKTKGKLVNKEKYILSFIFLKNFREEYCALYDRIHKSIFEMTNTEVLVDSSKNLSRGIALLKSSEFDVYFLHLIRDPRGFVNSMYKNNFNYIKSMGKWSLKNYFASLVLKNISRKRYKKIYYEDLLLSPNKTISGISDFTGIDFSIITNFIKNGQKFKIGHIFSGNRISNKHEISFDPARIQSNRIKKINNDKFWYSVGWLSMFYGYKKEQDYLN